MSDMFVVINDCAWDTENAIFSARLVASDANISENVVLYVPSDVMDNNVASINNTLIQAAKDYLYVTHGVSVGVGEKVRLLGGCVA